MGQGPGVNTQAVALAAAGGATLICVPTNKTEARTNVLVASPKPLRGQRGRSRGGPARQGGGRSLTAHQVRRQRFVGGTRSSSYTTKWTATIIRFGRVGAAEVATGYHLARRASTTIDEERRVVGDFSIHRVA